MKIWRELLLRLRVLRYNLDREEERAWVMDRVKKRYGRRTAGHAADGEIIRVEDGGFRWVKQLHGWRLQCKHFLPAMQSDRTFPFLQPLPTVPPPEKGPSAKRTQKPPPKTTPPTPKSPSTATAPLTRTAQLPCVKLPDDHQFPCPHCQRVIGGIRYPGRKVCPYCQRPYRVALD